MWERPGIRTQQHVDCAPSRLAKCGSSMVVEGRRRRRARGSPTSQLAVELHRRAETERMGSRDATSSPGEPDLSWMSFSPEAHGLKPALSVWPSCNINSSSPDAQQQQQTARFEKENDRNGHGWESGRGWSKSERREEQEIVEEQEEVEWVRRRRTGSGRDWGKEQERKVSDDFEDDDGEHSSFVEGGAPRPYPAPPGSVGRGSQARRGQQGAQKQQREKEGCLESLDESTGTVQPPWRDKIAKLQFGVTVAFASGLVALVVGIFLLYLSFGATVRPPSSCEVDKLVLNFTARRIRLRGGRYISFREQGVSADGARHSLLITHDLVSSRLAGIPGISESLLKEFGVRLIAYDRPGYGQSDPHPGRSYNSSAQDMADIGDALGVGEKFWVVGFGSGGPHVWAAVNYIPERLSGVALFAPAGSFYAEDMTKEEVAETWALLNLRQKWMYSVARLFPALLPSLMQKTLVEDNLSPIRTLRGPPVGFKDQDLMGNEDVLHFWERDVKEALQQQCAFPMAEELILLVNNWGFSLGSLPFNEREGRSLLRQVVGLFQSKERRRIFSGPIHIWQGTDDQHVPATMNEYAKRMILRNDIPKSDSPVYFHTLEGEGHFSWFWFCDECHRAIFNALFQPQEEILGPFGRQVFSPEEYEAILAAFGVPKQKGVEMLAKTEEAPVTIEQNVKEATDDPLYRNADSEEEASTGLKLYVPETCEVPIDLSTFIIRAIDERIRKYIR